MSAITKTPGVCGGRACIAGRRIEVAYLERCRRARWSAREIMEMYGVSRDELAAAWEYVRANREEIDAEIAEMGER